jgi:hypothetical protein
MVYLKALNHNLYPHILQWILYQLIFIISIIPKSDNIEFNMMVAFGLY